MRGKAPGAFLQCQKVQQTGILISQAGKQALRRITSREEPEALPYSNKYRVEALEADNRSFPGADLPCRTILHRWLLVKRVACATLLRGLT